MIDRKTVPFLQEQAQKFPIIAVTGCRQSGKTTLVRHLFSHKPYANLEDPELRQYATEDPRGFLSEYPEGAVLDEIQRVPELFSYLQVISDEKHRPGMFILTGSQSFALMASISQSLAGRVLLCTLLPFSMQELRSAGRLPNTVDEVIFSGGYPRIIAENMQPDVWYSSYINTYVERDLRMLTKVQNLDLFQKFIGLCAGRIGQLVNYNALATETGVNDKTIRQWINLLQASYLLFELRPFHNNFGKRLTKSAKLYFCDTGVACSLLGIRRLEHLNNHPLRGALFENLMVLEYLKQYQQQGRKPDIYFWRDHTGHEIDLILGSEYSMAAVEIKSAQTLKGQMFQNLAWFSEIAGKSLQSKSLIYGGSMPQNRMNGKVIPWDTIDLDGIEY